MDNCKGECGPVGTVGLPGADWNGGKGGDRGAPGPVEIEAKNPLPWYVVHLMKQSKRNRVR